MALRSAVVALGSAMVLAGLSATPASAQATGETMFKQRCGMCHTPGKSLMGPDLTGLMTRPARPTFAYSPAMLKQPVKWDPARLDAFLAGPQKVVPGSKMMVMAANPADRALLIGYLKTLK